MYPLTEELLVEALRGASAEPVRRRVVRQLLSSLLYEDALAADVDGATHVVPGEDADGAPVRYVFEAGRALGFDRVLVAERTLRRVAADGSVSATPSVARFLGEVRDAVLGGAYPDELARFAGELEETRIKDTLSEHVRARRGDVLAGADHDLLEGTVTAGHRYHPTYKSRIGFDLDDDVEFGPEFLPAVTPFWVAAHRSIAQVSTSSALADGHGALPRGELGPACVAAFDERVSAAGGDPADHVWVPVHPWQWREVVRTGFADQLAERTLVPLGPDPSAFSPQQSIRTLACRDRPARSNLKLAMSITNTSTDRGLAPHTVRNAAPVTDWLDRILARDAVLRDAGLSVLGEVHGVAVVPPPESALVRGRTEGRLAAIWRRSLAPALRPGERAVPVTALTATELDGTPLVAPWLGEHGPQAWVEALTDAVALPLVHLLVRHGVALEAHAQNMSLVHVDGLPRRVAVRDFHDGVRFCRRLLADPDDAPLLDAPPAHHANRNSFVETDDPALVTDFLLDALFFVNLGELGLFLDRHRLLTEETFWRTVAARVHTHQTRYGTGTFDVLAPTLAVEKLTTRRLAPDIRLRLHTVSNPLHRFRPPGTRGRGTRAATEDT